MSDDARLDEVFKALADPTRRLLLDRLRVRDGQALGELCGSLDMSRQSATQHLDQLVRVGLVTVVRRGRERLHYLNPVPIHDIGERWVAAYAAPRLAAISAIKTRAEEQSMTSPIPTYVYVTYIRATSGAVWHALTDADTTARYWAHANVSDWQPGSTWEHRRTDGSEAVDVVGTVLEAEPPTRLVVTFEDSDEVREHGPSVVTFLVEPHEDIVRLTVTHENLPNPEMLQGISSGWPAVLANLKSLLETGDVLPTDPWAVPSAAPAAHA
ncbi:SRPBCC domain-containing protein [Nocardioides sp. 503]|uniref:ArsR/SmtB family transcription factor n=1 Tax=Nocardioides sp. 503 TaxID=2508326 RepID=UPI001070386A|nr:SRPBCC domain-containing protein [Nocardioides sp. 503]